MGLTVKDLSVDNLLLVLLSIGIVEFYGRNVCLTRLNNKRVVLRTCILHGSQNGLLGESTPVMQAIRCFSL